MWKLKESENMGIFKNYFFLWFLQWRLLKPKVAKDKSIFQRTVSVADASGDLKAQFSLDLTPWDMSEMEGYTPREGVVPKKGHSCKISTLKPNKKYPKSRIDIDPSNKEFRDALRDMYKAYDEEIGKK